MGIVHAQESPPIQPEIQNKSDDVLAHCAQDQGESLPNTFSDVSPIDWAESSVVTLNYCGAYRGSIPPNQAEPLLKNPLPFSESNGHNEWEWEMEQDLFYY